MDIFSDDVKQKVRGELVPAVLGGEYEAAMENTQELQRRLYANIPDEKRISYGRYYTVKVLSEYLYTQFVEVEAPGFEFAVAAFEGSEDYIVQGVALGVLSFYGLGDLGAVLPYFEKGAAYDHWEVREFAASFFCKLTKAYPQEAKGFYLRLVDSPDPNVRRFVSESLRPVRENRWFHKNPEYPLSILRHMFRESVAYPRTSVGNNLSDWARREPEMVYGIVEELVASGDKNAYWIAYRACRNLVKSEPIRVMDLLGVDEYNYKKRVHKRSDYD